MGTVTGIHSTGKSCWPGAALSQSGQPYTPCSCNADKAVQARISLVNLLGQEVLTDTRYLGYAGAHLLKK